MTGQRISTRSSGFSLIELQMVIAIIAMLASMAVAGFSTLQNRARGRLTEVQLGAMHKFITARRVVGDMQTLIQQTGNTCTNCMFRGATMKSRAALFPLNNTRWAGIQFTDSGLAPLDGWGNPFAFDENEGEWAPPNDCRNDIIESAGPDGILYNADDYWLCSAFVRCQTSALWPGCVSGGYVGRGVPPF